MLCEFCQFEFALVGFTVVKSYKNKMLFKGSKHTEKKQNVFFHVVIVYKLYFKHGDFARKSVRFKDETLRFKREQPHEIVDASCLNVNGSTIRAATYLNCVLMCNMFFKLTHSC